MSAKQNAKYVSIVANLGKDIAGNLLSGNDIRALGYLKAQAKLLAALEIKMAAGNGDVRAEMALDAAMREISKVLDAEHEVNKMSYDNVDESFAKYSAAGYSIPDFIEPMAPIPV
jgi:hypothetical protein